MPTHVHVLFRPKSHEYSIAAILKNMKGRMSREYGIWLKENDPLTHCELSKNGTFRFWQKGGGFDRNLWNSKAIHAAIAYIENNPVRAGFVKKAGEMVQCME